MTDPIAGPSIVPVNLKLQNLTLLWFMILFSLFLFWVCSIGKERLTTALWVHMAHKKDVVYIKRGKSMSVSPLGRMVDDSKNEHPAYVSLGTTTQPSIAQISRGTHRKVFHSVINISNLINSAHWATHLLGLALALMEHQASNLLLNHGEPNQQGQMRLLP